MSVFTMLAAAFKGGGAAPVPLARSFVSPWAAAFESPGPAPFDYPRDAAASYCANPVAQRAVRIVAEGVGGAPLAGAEPDFLTLIAGSCKAQPLLEVLAAQLSLHGNAFVRIVRDGSGRPVELFPLRPERVQVVAGEDGWPAAHRYILADRTLTIALEDEAGWPNLVHLKHFHPLDDHYGAGSLAAARAAVAVHNAASEWNRALLANAARPSGALVYDCSDAPGLSSEQYERLKAELEHAFQGAGNAGRPMVLDGGLDWKAMSLSPADMDFAALKAAAARDIALAFGVPPMLLGLPGDSTYANYREANRALWRLTLLPLARKILEGLQAGLGEWFAEAPAVDLDRVPALAEDRERLWAQVGAADFLTGAEKRALLGLDAGETAA